MRGQTRFAWLLASPAIVLMLALGIVPLVWMVWTAVHSF